MTVLAKSTKTIETYFQKSKYNAYMLSEAIKKASILTINEAYKSKSPESQGPVVQN